MREKKLGLAASVLYLLKNIFLSLTTGIEKTDFCHLNAGLLQYVLNVEILKILIYGQ